MELIDTHCHLTFEQLANDVEQVLQRSKAAGVTSWITIGTDPDQNRKAIELAEKFENMYAAVGIHPHEAKDVSAETLTELIKIAQNEKVVAIGETGLDFHYNFSKPEQQEQVFVDHLKIAAGLELPIIVHCREAFDQTIGILQQFSRNIQRIVFHCFTGTAQQAKIILDMGFYISFTGVVTFRNSGEIREAAKLVPLDRLMLETDCPYMAPEPMRKQKINEPALILHTAKFLAGLKQMNLTDFAKTVTASSIQFFNLPITNKE